MTAGSQRPPIMREPRAVVNHEFASIQEFIDEYITNISRSGAFVRCKEPLPVGTDVQLKFSIILDDIETIEGVGRVVRVSEQPAGMGVVFTELSAVSQGLIEKLLARRLAGGQ